MGARLPVAQKLVALADAIMTSAPDAAKRHGLSEHTIWKAAEEYGGLRALRELYETARIGAVSEMAKDIKDELKRRLPHLGERSFTAVTVKLIEHPEAAAPSAGVNINLSQQQGQVQAHGDLSAAESAYLAALAGQSSLPPGQALAGPTLPISGNGVDGPKPAEDYPEGEADRHLDGDNG